MHCIYDLLTYKRLSVRRLLEGASAHDTNHALRVAIKTTSGTAQTAQIPIFE